MSFTSPQKENAPDAATARSLVQEISGGIRERGFHVIEEPAIQVLWKDGELDTVHKVDYVHSFAAAHGWFASTGQWCRGVLFMPDADPAAGASGE
ncbi:MAG TPA: hypothetical protein VF593_08215 [Chthoniobacteraceae bacterium]|jgi:radical SAM superfamily enzyme